MRALIFLMTLALLAGCDESEAEDCVGDAGIVPACGIAVGEGAIVLGEGRADVETLLGPAPSMLDLGALGTRFTYVDPPVSGLYAADDTVSSVSAGEGFAGASAGGAALGSAGAAVSDEFGSPDADPVLGVWWYPGDGIAWRLEGDTVVGVEIFSAR
jgi:hypothetical protein